MKFILTSFLFFSSLLGAETRLAILGSGTPNPDPQRMGSSYAVIVNDNAYLVDFGPGVIRRAAELSPNWGGDIHALVPAKLKHAFLTHIHSDHTMGLSDFYHADAEYLNLVAQATHLYWMYRLNYYLS